MASKLPTLPTHLNPSLDAIEAAMKAAKAKRAESKPGEPTVVGVPVPDILERKLAKLRLAEAKAKVKATKAAKAQGKRAFRALATTFRLITQHLRKSDRAVAMAMKKEERAAMRTPDAKAAKRLTKVLATLSPEAFSAFELVKDLNAADALGVAKALTVLAKAFVPAAPAEDAPEATDEVVAEAV